MSPILALLTDFGTADSYVASMKGVILTICRDAVLVDVSHDIEPQAVLQAALVLDASFGCFPPGTVFVAVVDPGVGTSRRAVALQAGGYTFVAPDNGVLTGVLRREEDVRAVELTQPQYWRSTVSATFEGRDRFAPAGAWLCRGVALEQLGPRADNLQRVEWPSCTVWGDHLEGAVLHADRFGNLLTSIPRDTLAEWSPDSATRLNVEIDRVPQPLALVRTFADLAPGQLGALVGSSGWLELCVRNGSARAALEAVQPRHVRVRRHRPD